MFKALTSLSFLLLLSASKGGTRTPDNAPVYNPSTFSIPVSRILRFHPLLVESADWKYFRVTRGASKSRERVFSPRDDSLFLASFFFFFCMMLRGSRVTVAEQRLRNTALPVRTAHTIFHCRIFATSSVELARQ